MKNNPQTVLSALIMRLRDQTKRYNPALESAPITILWTDEKREWEKFLPQIKKELPELFTLGNYDPENRSGPGVWLRMVADGQAGKLDGTPILYLPGISNNNLRSDLREVKDDPQLAPLAELQYRGMFWRQENSKDWTLRAFLESKRGGLGLSVAGNQDTLQALSEAFGKLLNRNLPALSGQNIDERFLDQMMNPNPDEDVLHWLSSPETIQQEKGDAWPTFVSSSRARFGIDLTKGPVEVAQKILASQSGDATFPLWEKYCVHWHSYPAVYDVFKHIAPPDLLQGAERYPRENEADEIRLAEELIKILNLEPTAAANHVLELDRKHRSRRETLWAEMGHAPLATALKHLTEISQAFMSPLNGGTISDFARHYAESGWHIDSAARMAMALAQDADIEKPVYAVLETLYRRWLEKNAEAFQTLVQRDGYPHWDLPEVPDGAVVVFVDGLRFDLARDLEAVLASEGISASLEHGFTSVPSVTSSGKVWVSPVAKLAQGGSSGGFEPKLPKGDYTADKLRKVMEAEAYAIVDTENPTLAYGKGWAEFPGDIDSDGHNKGLRLARAVPAHLDDLKRTIRRLLAAGWKEVWVITDHGWLLLPGGLPKVELPAKVTETKWGRCAVLKDTVDDQDWFVLPWSFDSAVRIALARGISAFSSGREYDHGGLSPQESIIPLLKVSRPGPIEGQPRITTISWNSRKTICSVIAVDATGLDITLERLGSTIGEAECIDENGKGRVIFEEVEDLLGEQVSLVLRREGQKVCEERLNFGDNWHAA